MRSQDYKLLALYRHLTTSAAERAAAERILRARGIDPDYPPPPVPPAASPPPPVFPAASPPPTTELGRRRRSAGILTLAVVVVFIANIVSVAFVLPFVLGEHLIWYMTVTGAYMGVLVFGTLRRILVLHDLRGAKAMNRLVADIANGWFWPTDLILRALASGPGQQMLARLGMKRRP